MNHVTGPPLAETVERRQIERVFGAAAQIGNDVRPVDGAELARRPLDRMMATMIQHEAEDATAAVAARHPAQLHAGARCHDNAQRRCSRRS